MKKQILINANRSYLYELKKALGILGVRIDIIEPYIRTCINGIGSTPHLNIMCIPYERYHSWQGFEVDECFYVDDHTRSLFRKDRDKDIFTGTVIDYIVKIEKEAAEEESRMKKSEEKIDILDFIENVMGLELLPSQKELVNQYARIKNCQIVMGRYGRIHVVPKDEVKDE